MIPKIPSNPYLTPRSLLGEKRNGVLAYFAEHGIETCAFYGYGKVAVRDGIDLLRSAYDGTATNILLPAYVPDGLVEPFREANLEPRFYRITSELRPDLPDVRRLADDDTLAIMAVQYFGLPLTESDVDALRACCDRHGAFLVDDSAHSALSARDGRLLGSFGDLGVTSLRKTLPVPNGAVLYITDERLRKRTTELTRVGTRSRLTAEDGRFVARSICRAAAHRPLVRRPLSALREVEPSDRTDHATAVADGGRRSASATPDSRPERDPTAIYEAAKVPMSRLTELVLERTNPEGVIDARRSNYRAWLTTVEAVDGIDPIVSSLPAGACPQYFPALVETPPPGGDLADLAHPWPPLPGNVRDDERYSTANHFSSHLYPLPVHQCLTPAQITALST